MRLSELLPILLLTIGGASVACVLYTVQGNYKSLINRIFTAMGISLLLWSLGLAIQTAGADPSIRFVGSRLAPVGYSTMFAFLLHYVMLLTRHDRIEKRRWIYLLIYAPGIVLIGGLTVWPLIAQTQDDMRLTGLGWANVTSNGWYNAFYCYYITYFILIAMLLKNWGSRTAAEEVRKQSRLLLDSLWICVALGTVAEVLLPLLHIQKPSVAPLFSLLPILSISYCVKRYGFMQPEVVNPNEIILDRANRTRVYQILGLFFLIGSLMNIFSQHLFYQETALPSAILFSGILFLIGCGILLLGRLSLDELFKELLFATLFSLLIPFVTLRFAVYGSITIWTFFFPLLMISLLFNKRILLITVLLSVCQTQLLIFSISPLVSVKLDSADYMIRLCLIALTGAMSLYINKVYRHRLKENAGHVYRQAIVTEIAHSMVSADERSFDRKVSNMLSQCGSFIRCEWAYLALWNRENGEIQYCCEWRADGFPSMGALCEKDSPLICPELRAMIPDNQVLAVPEAALLPPQAENAKSQLLGMGIRGFILISIVSHGEELGLMSFATASGERDWDREPPAFLSIIADTIADTVVKLEDRRKIEWAAFHDHLTGLPNRLLYKSRLSQEIERAEKNNALIGVAFIDLDAFKSINDNMGHEAGDQLLQEVSKAIAGSIRPDDIVARIGGDEFVLLLSQAPHQDDLVRVVRDVLEAIQKPIILHGYDFYITGSIGVSFYPHDGTDAETLMKNADIAMYEAKSLGKTQYVLCSQALKDKALDNARLTNLLYRALEKNQLDVYYQPQISLETGGIVGLEALLRWKLPDQGFVSPAVFIPLAEQTGLIQPIGEWVLETACSQCMKWQLMGFPPVRVAVNISMRQLENKGFMQLVAYVLRRTGLSPEYLELEITESAANSEASDMVELMTGLRGLGVSISIDDFGTEYSSLGRLKLMPIDRIKMDMQFVRGIENSDKDRAIAQVIINLAKSLKMKVIAEGVESAAQLSFLSRQMCDEVQGYYYYKPMPPDELEKIFRCCPDFDQKVIGQAYNASVENFRL